VEQDLGPTQKVDLDPNVRRLQDDLTDRLGARVQIQQGGRGAGKLVIAYNSLDELDGILAHIK
jgi:ParB family chromosome partitioning protein